MGLDPQTVQLVASRYNDWATPAHPGTVLLEIVVDSTSLKPDFTRLLLSYPANYYSIGGAPYSFIIRRMDKGPIIPRNSTES
jgi:hypothetical protein